MQSDNPNSAVNWWPKIDKLPVPTPYTELVDVSQYDSIKWLDEGVDSEVLDDISQVIDYYFGYPVFIRTDLESGKHDYNKTCFVLHEQKLERNIHQLVQKHFLPMRPHDHSLAAFMIREYLNIKSKFTAFYEELPIGVEVRHFIKDGEWEKGHYYWPKESIWHPDSDSWEKQINEMIEESKEDLEKHQGMASLIAGAISGDWSLDFAKTEQGVWYLIDMARYEDSYMADNEELYL